MLHPGGRNPTAAGAATTAAAADSRGGGPASVEGGAAAESPGLHFPSHEHRLPPLDAAGLADAERWVERAGDEAFERLASEEIARRLAALDRKVVTDADTVHASRSASHASMIEASRAVERARQCERRLQAAMVELRRTEHARAMYAHAAAVATGADAAAAEADGQPRAKKKRKRRKKGGAGAAAVADDKQPTTNAKSVGTESGTGIPQRGPSDPTLGSGKEACAAAVASSFLQSALQTVRQETRIEVALPSEGAATTAPPPIASTMGDDVDDDAPSDATLTEDSSLNDHEDGEMFRMLAFRAVQRGSGDTALLPPPAVSSAMDTLRLMLSEDGATLSSATESAAEDVAAVTSPSPRDIAKCGQGRELSNDLTFDVLLFEAIHSFRETTDGGGGIDKSITVKQALEETGKGTMFREGSLLPMALSALRMDGKRTLRLGLDVYLRQLTGQEMAELAQDAATREAAAYLAAKKLRAHNFLKECCEAEALVADYQLLRRRVERWIRNATAVGSATVAAVTSEATGRVVEHVTNLTASTVASVTSRATRAATISALLKEDAGSIVTAASAAAAGHGEVSFVKDALATAEAALEREQLKEKVHERKEFSEIRTSASSQLPPSNVVHKVGQNATSEQYKEMKITRNDAAMTTCGQEHRQPKTSSTGHVSRTTAKTTLSDNAKLPGRTPSSKSTAKTTTPKATQQSCDRQTRRSTAGAAAAITPSVKKPKQLSSTPQVQPIARIGTKAGTSKGVSPDCQGPKQHDAQAVEPAQGARQKNRHDHGVDKKVIREHLIKKLDELPPRDRNGLIGAEHMHRIAQLYTHIGSKQEGQQFFNKALSIRSEALGSQHKDTCSTRDALAALYRSQGRLNKVKALYKTLPKRAQTAAMKARMKDDGK
mmetsp:Transcript_14015/g.36079  ORF Transcript_14015/g.36079 Transcript_14015/m.36079 type:complete len:891 (-) Transcript_14015:186-2858(-)